MFTAAVKVRSPREDRFSIGMIAVDHEDEDVSIDVFVVYLSRRVADARHEQEARNVDRSFVMFVYLAIETCLDRRRRYSLPRM